MQNDNCGFLQLGGTNINRSMTPNIVCVASYVTVRFKTGWGESIMWPCGMNKWFFRGGNLALQKSSYKKLKVLLVVFDYVEWLR